MITRIYRRAPVMKDKLWSLCSWEREYLLQMADYINAPSANAKSKDRERHIEMFRDLVQGKTISEIAEKHRVSLQRTREIIYRALMRVQALSVQVYWKPE